MATATHPVHRTSPGHHAGALPRATAAGIRRGLRADEFFVVYMPQLDLRSGRIVGVEALVRWNHSRLGSLTPGDFLPVAEESGAIVAIDDHVLTRACADVAGWRDAGYGDLRLAVNLSVRSVEAPALIGRIEERLERFDLPPSQLELEVTESAAVRDGDRVVDALGRLRQVGVQVALDDFGTGYSMFDRLRTLPFDALKIDRSFVAALGSDAGPQLLLAAIALGHALNLRVVGEGVEEQEQLDFLRRHQCDEAQGYLIGRPMPSDALLRLLQATAVPAVRPRSARVPEVFGTDSQALERLVRPLLGELARLTKLESTYLTFIDRQAGEQVIVYARNDAELNIGQGLHVPWKDTVCKRSLESGVRCTSDVPAMFGDSPAGRQLGLRTYAGVPVLTEDGSVWGTLCGASTRRRSVAEPTLAVMESFARLVARQLQMLEWQAPAA